MHDDKWPYLFGLSIGKETKNGGTKTTWRTSVH